MTTEQDREPLPSKVKRLEGEVGPHAHHPLLHLPVIEQLKQRNVFRVAVLYVVVCWLILDPLHVIFHMAGVPEWVNRLVLIVMAVGFPLVLIFAWVYEITPEGLKHTVEVPHSQSIRQLTGRRLDRAIIAVLCVALAYFVVDKFWISKHLTTSEPVAAAASRIAATVTPAATAAFSPPPHSIAVLPFVNISGDKEQEYFSEGLTEELLNSLSRINDLQVAARTSSFSFQGEHPDIATVAQRLNVGAVLEGSVRRSAHTVRITAQLVNSVTGFHVWSQTYDRDLGDVLKLQTEIATRVAGALKVTLLGDEEAKIELGGTRTAAAFDAYLRASNAYWVTKNAKSAQAAIDGYSEAIRLDPNYALAYTGRSLARGTLAANWATGPAIQGGIDNARADALRALALAPELAEGHLALAVNYQKSLEFPRASAEYERALALGPGNARLLRNHGGFAVYMGHTESGLAALRRAVVLDPLNSNSYIFLGDGLRALGRYDEAMAAFRSAAALEPDNPYLSANIGVTHYLLGDLQGARASCEGKAEAVDYGQFCLAMTYHRLGRFADAERMLAKIRASDGDSGAYSYTAIYSQWGNTRSALSWLETAMQLRVPDLARIRTSPLLEPLRKEPRFQAIERELKFPD